MGMTEGFGYPLPSPPPTPKFLVFMEIAKIASQNPEPVGLTGKILSTKDLGGTSGGWKWVFGAKTAVMAE